MSYYDETSEQRQARWDLEEKQALAAAQKAWEEKYKKLKPIERWKDETGKKRLTFQDWVKETEKEHSVKTTTITFQDGQVARMYSSTNKRQKFLVVSGPLAGKRIADGNEDYVLFNRNSRDYTRGEGKTPKCVLVHKKSFK